MKRLKSKLSPPYLLLTLIWLLAAFLALVDLGNLPIRDFDEGTVARVSFELSQQNFTNRLIPTLWNDQYLNKPPGLHWIIALIINLENYFKPSLGGLPSEFILRLGPSLISSLVVPIGGLIQWNLRKGDRISSLATAGILLTLLPVVRHGRLAMLDGSQLSLMALLWLLLITIDSTYKNRFRVFSSGLVSSALLLLKAPFLIPAGFAAFISVLIGKRFKLFWNWDFVYFFLLGLSPGISWHCLNALNNGMGAFWLWGGDGAGRVLFDPGQGSDLGFLVPLMEIVEGGWPWLLLWPLGIFNAWQERHTKWGQWALGTQITLALSIFPLKTQLPWYGHPLWLPFAIICAPTFASLIKGTVSHRRFFPKLLFLIPIAWSALGLVLLGTLSFVLFVPIQAFEKYVPILSCLGFGWFIGGFLMTSSFTRNRLIGGLFIFASNFLALLILMTSTLWIWELNESWFVRPVAEIIRQQKASPVFIAESYERPSLNWYAEQKIKNIKYFKDSGWIIAPENSPIMQDPKYQFCHKNKQINGWDLFFCRRKQ